MKFIKLRVLIGLCLFVAVVANGATNSPITLSIDAAKTDGKIDLTKYALCQGGHSENPILKPHLDQIAQLHPQTIRIFIQELFDLYPAHGRYQWEKLDRFIEHILATGAKPIVCLCFKPKVLFPKIDQTIVHPNNYKEWEELIFQLVKHCQEKKFGIEYWEISNEPDIGEGGGCPYLFKKEDYVIYYQHTAAAIQRADAKAKVGGPALANPRSDIGDALLEHCGTTDTPLDFFSWHLYSGEPKAFRFLIHEFKAKFAKYPKLKNCEMIIDEWNVDLFALNYDPSFQPAFILENTLGFQEEGVSRSAYYHIRDYYIDEKRFAQFMSPEGAALTAEYWNVLPQLPSLCGIWDNQGRVRPAYLSFKLLSQIRGEKLSVQGTTEEVHALAAKNDRFVQIVLWNFSTNKMESVTLQTSGLKPEQRFFEMNLNVVANQLDTVRQGSIGELKERPLQFTLPPYGIRWIAISH
ncbi:MAG: hypothetical protein ABJC04_07215 [Verrucomicrobiota bacterium]